jgi:glycosyltransferase involved in cell wall biosynthesis
MKPFFSIGITAYNRNDLLRECLSSILQQEYDDIEIIVGNDYTKQKLTADILEIHDSRVTIINHEQNLGPIANANSLLAMSNGRYFTLLADDDMHARCFLTVMRKTLDIYNYPPCVFSSYSSEIERVKSNFSANDIIGKLKVYTGRQFLNRYLSKTVKTIGCYGVFEIEYLRSIGGMRQMGNGRSIYGEAPIVIVSGLLKEIPYVDYPLVFFRAHPDSLSNSSTNTDDYASSQKALLEECVHVLNGENVREDFHANMFLLLRWFVEDFVEVMHRSGSIHYRQAVRYIVFIWSSIKYFKGTPYYWKAMSHYAKIPTKKMLIIGAVKIKNLPLSIKQITRGKKKIQQKDL